MSSARLDWHHLRLDVASSGALLTISDASDGRVLGTMGFDLPSSWTPVRPVVNDDEVEWQWTHSESISDGHDSAPEHLAQPTVAAHTDGPESRAVVRISTEPTLSWRIALSTSTSAVNLEPPTMIWTPATPARRWVGGSEALLILDERPSDGLATAARLARGQAWPMNDPTPGPQRIRLGPPLVAVSPEHGYSAAWVIERFASLATATSALPTWLPRDCTPGAGEPVFLDLPDAAVTSDLEVVTDEHGTQLTAEEGTHLVEVHGPGIETSFAITWNNGTDRLLRQIASGVLSQVDPRTADGSDAALVDRADTAHLIPHDQAESFLSDFCLEVIDAPQDARVDPEATPALLHWAFGDPSRMTAVLARLSHFSPGPGSMLAWLSASLAARAARIDYRAAAPIDSDDPLCLALHAILTRAPGPTDAVWTTIGLLHGPLPGPLPSADLPRTAQACAVLSLAPPTWQIEQRLGTGLAHEIEDTRAWLAAAAPDESTLSWLLWA